MLQSIGKTIRKLRKERNLTQEELAELLNITSQAISKWENETGMPDISQIIPLARVLGVSTDILFGISGINEENEVERIIYELHLQNKNLEIDDLERYRQLTEALKQYPNNFSLLYNCFVNGCFILQGDCREKLSEEEQRSIYNECIRQSDVIISYCPNTDIVINTKRELIELLSTKGEQGKALALIKELPNSISDVSGMVMSRYFFNHGETSDVIETCHKNIYDLLSEMDQQSMLLAIAYMRSGEYEKAEKILLTLYDLIKAFFKEDTYIPPLHLGQSLYRNLAVCALRKNDEDRAIRYLEEMYEYTLKQSEGFQKVKYLKTPMLDSYKMDFNYPFYEPREILLAQLEMECFESLSHNGRFLALLEKVRQLSE